MRIASMFGDICLNGEFGEWQVAATRETVEAGVELIHLKMNAPAPAAPPRFTLAWHLPQQDIQLRWHPMSNFNRTIPADWAEALYSDLAHSAPVVQLSGINGENRLVFAVSEALRPVKIKAGINEENCEISCSVELFSVPEAPLASYETTLRFDARKRFYADAIRDAFGWFASMAEYTPAPVPPAAFDPVYSSWYSYHQDLFAAPLETECELAAPYGMRSVIVDDGWQTDDNNRGYAFCGDWELSRNRFPDMRGHVENIHRLGMKYIIWFSVPFVGYKSRNFKRFEGKYLYGMDRLDTAVLDPRFPDVREFLITIYENALREWDIDGFKLDFIDRFRFEGEDPAVKEGYAGRDIRSLPEAVDRLLSDTMTRLERIKPGVLIEFRQRYIGPAIRKYGNMLRVADCPGDILSNRVGMVDLRLSSGNSAVHSDMLEWHRNETAEAAALQLLNVFFCVPQISVRLAEISESHRAMLKFWLAFWSEHRETLLFGDFTPLRQELSYPVVRAETGSETIIAVYGSGQCVEVPAGKPCRIINATTDSELVLDLPARPRGAVRFDASGRPVPGSCPEAGLVRVAVPPSGLLELV